MVKVALSKRIVGKKIIIIYYPIILKWMDVDICPCPRTFLDECPCPPNMIGQCPVHNTDYHRRHYHHHHHHQLLPISLIEFPEMK